MESLAKINDENTGKLYYSYSPISKNRIINHELIKLERFLCSLCKNLLVNMKKCNLCSSHFCSDCIYKYKSENDSDYCPVCHMLNFKIDEGEAYLTKFLSELLIQCKYAPKGCTEVCYYQNLVEHESICKFREKTCDNCLKTLDSSEYYAHLIECFKLSENVENSIRQKRILSLIKAFDEKINKIKYENKYGVNTLKMEMQKSMSKLDEKIRVLEKYTSEQDYLIRVSGLEKFKMNSTLSIYGKIFKECQIYYFCRGGYNGCTRSGNADRGQDSRNSIRKGLRQNNEAFCLQCK